MPAFRRSVPQRHSAPAIVPGLTTLTLPRPGHPKRPTRPASLALLVLALHALLLAGAWRLQAWQDRGPAAPAQAPLIVWLPGAPRPALPAAKPPEQPEQPQAAPAQRAPATPPRALREPQAITWPASPAEPGLDAVAQPPVSAAPAVPAPAAAGPVPPLNLALPRGASAPWRGRNPALDDPRSNTPPPTLESRIAKALGGVDGIQEFRLEDGSVRFKRGNNCVIARPNRAGALDPFNASAQIRPRLLDSC